MCHVQDLRDPSESYYRGPFVAWLRVVWGQSPEGLHAQKTKAEI